MALADRLKSLFKSGESTVASHKGQAHDAVKKVAEEADQRTGNKYDSQIDSAVRKADEAIDNLDDTGRPAGKPGRPPGDRGRPPGDPGRPAGDRGRPPGDPGRPAGNP